MRTVMRFRIYFPELMFAESKQPFYLETPDDPMYIIEIPVKGYSSLTQALASLFVKHEFGREYKIPAEDRKKALFTDGGTLPELSGQRELSNQQAERKIIAASPTLRFHLHR